MQGNTRNTPRDKVAGNSVSRRLREYYDSVMEEAIPERFLDLLEKLDEADRARRDPTNRESPGNDG